eukprot:7534859-Pyramimonas_sp.AAC.1
MLVDVSCVSQDCRADEQSGGESAGCSKTLPRPPSQAEQLVISWAQQALTLLEQKTLLGPSPSTRPIARGNAPQLLPRRALPGIQRESIETALRGPVPGRPAHNVSGA